jgi:DNA-directed RNA polymerase subunit RPC12/RpoP
MLNFDTLKYGKEIIGAYGESSAVSCPACGSREYPHHQVYAKCLGCGELYRIPETYRPKGYLDKYLRRMAGK